MGLHKGVGGWVGEEGREGEAGRFQSGIWEQGGTVLCLLPSAHTEAKLNSNKNKAQMCITGSDFSCPQHG